MSFNIGIGTRLLVRVALASLLALSPVAAMAQSVPPQPAAPGLAGTTWQLVKFQGGDDTTLAPDDRAKYTH